MATKKELIAQLIAKNIFHRPSWGKAQLEEALESGLPFGSLVDCVCPRSGLIFQVAIEEVRDGAVHPRVGWYTSHKNTEIRYPAIRVIESQKWDTWENLKSAIDEVLNPKPAARPAYDFEGAWVARITGSSPQYRFERKFIDPVDAEGRFKRFNVDAAGDGVYECCYKSAKGNETRTYYRVQEGESLRLSLEAVEALFPKFAPPEDAIAIKEMLTEGSIIEREGTVYRVLKCFTKTRYEQVWDDFEDECATEPVFESTSYLQPVSEVEAAQFLTAKVQAEALLTAKKKASTRLKEIASTITKENGAVVPESAAYPSGIEFVTRDGYFQANEILVLENGTNRLWRLSYNGRDSDLWDLNNVGKTWIGCYLEIPADLESEIEEILRQC